MFMNLFMLENSRIIVLRFAIWHFFKSNRREFQIESCTFKSNLLLIKSNLHKWFSRNLNRIVTWICPSLPFTSRCEMDWTYSLMATQDSTDGSWDTKTWDISKKNGVLLPWWYAGCRCSNATQDLTCDDKVKSCMEKVSHVLTGKWYSLKVNYMSVV